MTTETTDTTAETLDGMKPFASLLAVLGVPSRSGRVLEVGGKFTLPGEVPVIRKGSDGLPYPCGAVGGLLWRGDRVYALGVADWDVAEQLNEEMLRLGLDMDAVASATDMTLIRSGIIRGVRVIEPGEFGWS